MLKKVSLILYTVLLAAVVAWKYFEMEAEENSSGKVVPVALTRGTFALLEFPSQTGETRAIVLFASGDGGWSGFEEQICQTLQQDGYDVMGVDCFKYAKSDYNLATLQADYGLMAARAEQPLGAHPVPVIIGGWSMGAGQAIAVAGGPKRPERVVGLLLVDPCARGRYGLRLSDQMNILPIGPGTFSMDEFAGTMGDLRVAQWHAALDSIDSRAWLGKLTAAHREYDFKFSGHFYNQDREIFLDHLAPTMSWILSPSESAVTSTGSKP